MARPPSVRAGTHSAHGVPAKVWPQPPPRPLRPHPDPAALPTHGHSRPSSRCFTTPAEPSSLHVPGTCGHVQRSRPHPRPRVRFLHLESVWVARHCHVSVCPGQVITAPIPSGASEPVSPRTASLLPGGTKQEGATWARLFPQGVAPTPGTQKADG